ncbi:hypothetical protein ABZ714_15630 [Streptomyces sp. NPDC006798]|uniref:hypothetical protein n=1 Tax=Streptomyces sp. NPDC006798 TaxID=3155462 RepID=UPI0033DA6F44
MTTARIAGPVAGAERPGSTAPARTAPGGEAAGFPAATGAPGDEPRPPASPGGWDARSHALLGGGTGPDGTAPEGTGRPAVPGPGASPAADTTPSGGATTATTVTTARAETAREPDPDTKAARASAGASDRASGGAARPRPGSGDPVKALLRRHRELCERAVDPLEIAAGLEAHGITDRIAGRFRHRDVFSLAEELYARVPGNGAEPPAAAPPADRLPGGAARALLPGAAAVATAVGRTLLDGGARTAVGALGTAAVGCAVLYTLRAGALGARSGARSRTARPGAALGAVLTAVLLGFAAYGEGLTELLGPGGPAGGTADGTAGGATGGIPLMPAPLIALAVAVAPAAWCARTLSVRIRRRLGDSRRLDDFAAGTRPLVLGAAAAFTAATAVVALATESAVGGGGTPAAAVALGLLLFTARLLAVHGFPATAVTGLAAACAGQTLATLLLLAARLPGLGPAAGPVDAVTAAWGPGGIAVLVCGTVAGGLLVRATAVLSRASAHT